MTNTATSEPEADDCVGTTDPEGRPILLDSLSALFETDMLGLAVTDAERRTLCVRGHLAGWLGSGEDVCRHGPLTGLEGEFEALRSGLSARFVLPNVQFGSDGVRVDIAITWNAREKTFVIMTTGFGDEELIDIAFRRARREERVAKEMLASERRRSMELYRHAPAMLCTVDGVGRLIEVNDHWCEMLLRHRHEAIGTRLSAFVVPDDHRRLARDVLERIVAGRPVRDVLVRMQRVDGVLIEVELSAARSRFHGDMPAPVRSRFDALIVMVDVTARNAARRSLEETADELATMNARLQSAIADLEIFAHGASHDLLTGLHQIGWSAELAEMMLREGQAAGPYISAVRDTTARMDETVRGLLTYARATSRETRLARVDARACAGQAVATLQHAIDRTGARVTIEDLPPVWADATLLTVVLQNLIQNAIKYNDGRPVITVSGTARDRSVVLSIDDNGIGIPPEQREIVFRPFRRIQDQAHRPGNGIGLTLCRRAIDIMDGRIQACESPLGGTRIRLTLQAAPQGDAEPRDRAEMP